MKKLWIVLGCLVAVVVAALVVLPRLLDVNRYRDRIQSELQTRLGRTVQLGQMNLGLFPPTFKVQNAVIGEDPKFDSGMPFAQTAELDILLKLEPLLHREVQVDSLRLVRPQVELIRAADGAWNFSSIGTHHEQQAKNAQPSKPLELDRLQIDDGSVAVTDHEKKQPRMEYSHIDLTLKDYAPGKPFNIATSAHLPGGGKQDVKLDGRGGPINDATLVSTPFDGTLQLNQVALGSIKQYLNSKALAGTDANVSGNLHFKNEGGKVSTNGKLRMDNVVARGKPLGFPIELNLNANDNLNADVVAVSNTLLKVGSSQFVINGTVNGKSTPPLADLKLNTQNTSLAELVKLADAFGATISPKVQPSGLLTADLTAKGPLSGPGVAGTLKTTQLKVSGVTANSLLITLNLAPPPPDADPVKTLTGKVSVNMTDGELTGVDMAQKLGEIGKFTGTTKAAQGATHFDSLTGDFDLKNGVASTNDLKALTDAGTIAATGTASLANQELNMRATAVLSKASSQQVGGSSIGGMMTTAMANNNGEIVIPVIVTGTISSPKVEPDLNAMAQMRMKGLLPSFSNPGQLTQGVLAGVHGGPSSVLNTLTGKSTPGAASSNQQQQNGNAVQNAIGGLGGLFGGKKSPQK